MFNAYFQIAAVGFICLIVLLLLMIKRKCVSVYKIFSLALIFVLSGCMLFFAIRAPKEKESGDAASEEKARCLDEYLAYSYAAMKSIFVPVCAHVLSQFFKYESTMTWHCFVLSRPLR